MRRRCFIVGAFALISVLFVLPAVSVVSHATESFVQYLPQHKLTPGVPRYDLSLEKICKTKWGKDERAVTAAMKRKVFLSYGFQKLNKDPRCPCEIDHLISRELGGADDVKNLWPQQYKGDWNAHMKDRLENRLHKEVCDGNMSLGDAQNGIAENWIKLWVQFFGNEQ